MFDSLVNFLVKILDEKIVELFFRIIERATESTFATYFCSLGLIFILQILYLSFDATLLGLRQIMSMPSKVGAKLGEYSESITITQWAFNLFIFLLISVPAFAFTMLPDYESRLWAILIYFLTVSIIFRSEGKSAFRWALGMTCITMLLAGILSGYIQLVATRPFS